MPMGIPMAYDVMKRPGAWVREQARRRERRLAVTVGFGVLLMLLTVWLALSLRAGLAAFAAAAALYSVARAAERQGKSAARWTYGGRSEEGVGETLNGLRHEGFIVMHDIEEPGEGNVDHLVSGRSGVFLVETKHRSYELQHLRKAKRQAAKLHDELGIWVTPVVCLDQRRGKPPYRHDGVWIVCREDVAEWVRRQRNAQLPFARLAAFADRL